MRLVFEVVTMLVWLASSTALDRSNLFENIPKSQCPGFYDGITFIPDCMDLGL